MIIDATRLCVWSEGLESLRSVVSAGLAPDVVPVVVNALVALSTVKPRPPCSWRLAVIPPTTFQRHTRVRTPPNHPTCQAISAHPHARVQAPLLSCGPGGTTFEMMQLVLKTRMDRLGLPGFTNEGLRKHVAVGAFAVAHQHEWPEWANLCYGHLPVLGFEVGADGIPHEPSLFDRLKMSLPKTPDRAVSQLYPLSKWLMKANGPL